VKILVHGGGRPRWERELVCTGGVSPQAGCGALLLVEEGDLLEKGDLFLRQRLAGLPAYFRCPECGALTAVSPEKLPARYAR
jgi:hypothetical protein